LRRQLVRVAAPAALLLAATVAVLLVRSAVRADDDEQPEPATVSRTATTREQATAPRQRRTPRRTYTVQEGDTLDKIALEQDTSVQALLAANPGVEPTELRPGQRLRLP
jgi:LysM repeat protein